MSVYFMRAVPAEARKEVFYVPQLELLMVVNQHMSIRNQARTLEEQQMLFTAEPSLQPLIPVFQSPFSERPLSAMAV